MPKDEKDDTPATDSMAKPTQAARAEALKCPDGWVYVIDGDFDPEEDVPPEAIVGAWKVDPAGRIAGNFVPNPSYRPKRPPEGQRGDKRK